MIAKNAHYSRAMSAIFPDWKEDGASAIAAVGRMAEGIDDNHADLLCAAERATKDLAELIRDVSSGRGYRSNPLGSSCFEDMPMLVARGATLRELFWLTLLKLCTEAKLKEFGTYLESLYAQERGE